MGERTAADDAPATDRGAGRISQSRERMASPRGSLSVVRLRRGEHPIERIFRQRRESSHIGAEDDGEPADERRPRPDQPSFNLRVSRLADADLVGNVLLTAAGTVPGGEEV
jgi:hypothetical protein